MKSKKQIKKDKLKKLIDNIDDEEVLNQLNEEEVPYITKSNKHSTEEDDLSAEQLKELEKGFKEMESGKYATMADFKKAMGKWLYGCM